MPAPEERITLNQFLSMVLQGVDGSGNNKDGRPVRITDKRELMIYSPLRAYNGTVVGVIRADAQNLLRTRPYEPIYPVESVILGTSTTTIYTSTSARSRIYVDVVNSGGVSGQTCSIQRFVTAASAGFDVLPPGTPVPLGVPIKVGHVDLDSGGFLQGTSLNGSVTVNVRVDRYSATGDTP